jgi:hypothetical protein
VQAFPEPIVPKGEEFPGPIVKKGDFKFTGPYTHDNLTVFLLHGPDLLKDRKFLTLQEALEKHQAIVHETGNVNALAVENLSSDGEVYIQSGDIVKGGQQDRVIQYDVILSPHSGKIPLASFCVEHGRWHGRGEENSSYFASSGYALSDKELKLAAKYKHSQQQVWSQVESTRARLKSGVGTPLRTASESSLQLTLEAPEVQESIEPFVQKLSAIIKDKPDAIGFAYAINGQVNSAEVYATHALFVKLWPKLLRASAVEAFSERQKSEVDSYHSAEVVRLFLADAEQGKAYLQTVSERTQQVMQETDRNLLFETRDRQQEGVWIHRCYLAK